MKRFLALFALVLCPMFGLGQDTGAKLDRLLSGYYQHGLLNGTVLVAEHGKVIYSKGFGYANFEWKIPNTPDTKFRIGSVTKLFTGVLIMQQVQAGRIILDAPLSTYLPDYRKDTGSKVTVRHLLTHTSGIPSYIGRDMEKLRGTYSPEKLSKELCSGDLTAEPGAQFAYNNCGYLLLGMIVERVTGKTYAEVLRTNITEPLGMKDTGVDDGRTILSKRAYGYDKTDLSNLRTAVYTEISTALGAGDIYSTAEDMLRFDQAFYTDKLLSAETRAQMFTPQNDRTGLTWFIDKPGYGFAVNGETVMQHHGNVWGFFTNYMRVPDRQLFVITMDNTHMPFEQLNRDILAVIYGKPVAAPANPIAAIIGKVLMRDGSRAAIAEYRRLRESHQAEYDFSEAQLNRLGYELIGIGKPKDAIEIFKLNVEIFPGSANVYDSLAEAYMIDGEVEPAIANYEKSLQMNANNLNAMKMLTELRGAQKTQP